MSKAEQYAAQIRQIYPELSIETIRVNQDGQYNEVLVVNETLIFRFARYPASVATLQREVRILQAIQEYVPLPIPNPIYHNLATPVVGEAFMGYKMLPGMPLWRPLFQTIGTKGRRTIARQLASFLRTLHSVPIMQLIPDELPVADTHESYADMYGRIRRQLFPHMRREAQQEVAHHFESFLNDPTASHFEPKLRHGDFGTGNLLFDVDNQIMSGIIDFSFASLGDPATDFAAVLTSFGELFFRECAKAYPAMADALPRVRFYLGTFALQEALFGVENGDEAAFVSGMANYT